MMRFAAGFTLLAIVLGGCADSQIAGSLFYLPPYKFEDLDCATLKAKVADATARSKAYDDLREKAGTAPGGGAVGTMVYAPDHQRAGWDKELFEQQYARKRCTDAPPAVVPPPQTAVIPR